jgi:catechol 2,3-dioxygenase-like lactoylglutathione lyase family enzyme
MSQVNRSLLSGLRGTESLPCLLVDDLPRASEYYREVLGFSRTELLGQPPAAVLARRAEGAVLLQRSSAPAQPYTQRRYAPQAWDAVIYVADIDRVAADLHRRGARVQVGIGIAHVSDHTLEVRDDWGNLLAFAATPAGLREHARAAMQRVIPASTRIGLRDQRLARVERPHLEEFRAFYDQLTDQNDIYYMFFAGGLLHWVVNAERHIPGDVNLVLVGSALSPAEQDYIRAHLKRPFHNIRLGVDDNTTWEFLFAVNRRNFGYIDIDCFALNPALFGELAQIPDDVAVNAIWTYEAAPGIPIGCTHFTFINAAVVQELHRRGRDISPTNYDWAGSDIPSLHSRTYCRLPDARQRRMLLEVLPPDDRGRPLPPGEAPFFDTLVAYQVVASATGFRTNRTRPLVHRTQASLHTPGTGGRTWQQDMSDEVIHVGGVSYYWKFFHLPEFRRLYLAVEHAMLSQVPDGLPPAYAARLDLLQRELGYLGLSDADAADLVWHHLETDRGLSADTVGKVLSRAPQPQRQP